MFENGFFETEFAGCHLKLCLACNLIDCLVKCRNHRLIRRVHCNEHGAPENNAGDRQGPAE